VYEQPGRISLRSADIKIEPAQLRFSVTEDLQLFRKVDEARVSNVQVQAVV